MSEPTLHINLTSLQKNLNYIQTLSSPTVETAAVVKANAYGLGVDPLAVCLFNKGVNTFFVSTASEAVELRLLLQKKPTIYYLNGYSVTDYNAVNDYDIIPVLNSLAQIENFKQKLHNKPAAMQLDVGMKRLGINSYEILKAKELCRSINLKLILGHLSSADDRSDPANIQQLKQFLKLSKYFLNVPKSLSATGGTLLGKRYHFNLTRPGIGIFGGKPLKNAANVVSIELPVLQVKDIKKNEGVGYNHTFVSPTQKKIAIVGSGYADGLSRQLSNRGFLYAGSVKCPIIGRVSMDLITVDISKLPIAPINLSVLGPSQTIDDLAEQSRTIGYEVLTSLGSRYKRVYHY